MYMSMGYKYGSAHEYMYVILGYYTYTRMNAFKNDNDAEKLSAIKYLYLGI